jgi:homoserine kinase type II
MSVYTPVSTEELNAWLARYAVGALVELAPIASGIENTNYFVTTAKGGYVLTLYERLPAGELPFYLNLMAHLARAGVPAPAPEPDRSSALFSLLNGKPASLVTRLPGAPITTPDTEHCAAVGGALAQLHVASATYRPRLANRRGPSWWRQAARAVRPFLDAAQNDLLVAELKFLTGFGKGALPRGAIHGDLFCDNVLFVGAEVSGIIDFGFAATDFLAYDLAIAVNDWCTARDGSLDAALVAAMADAYHRVRPLTADERNQWAALLRAAALRFWLSRLYDLHLPRPGELTHAHDPAEFERILRDRVAAMPRFPAVPQVATAAMSAPAK